VLNFNSPVEIRKTLERLGIRLQKRWGQNFLVNQGARKNIVSLLAAGARDTVWEIGPGLGTLTVLLLPQVHSLVGFEIDRGLVRHLNEIFAGYDNFRIIPGDVLKSWKPCYVEQGTPDRIIGNLPYSCASALIGALAEERVQTARMVFTVQRELAQRMTARPGSKNYSSFTVLCQLVYRIAEEAQLKPGSFFPAPEVYSSVIVLTPDPQSLTIPRWRSVLRVLRLLFRSRRKTMRNNLLAAGFSGPAGLQRLTNVFGELGIDPGLRSERLTPPQLLQLCQRLAVELEEL
jgi:16S rRNA (adenine1518-N6/adenine1519-N6)-dimethyltransferase